MNAMMTPGQDDVEILEESYPVWYSKIGVRPFMNLHNIIERVRLRSSIQKLIYKHNFKSKINKQETKLNKL